MQAWHKEFSGTGRLPCLNISRAGDLCSTPIIAASDDRKIAGLMEWSAFGITMTGATIPN